MKRGVGRIHLSHAWPRRTFCFWSPARRLTVMRGLDPRIHDASALIALLRKAAFGERRHGSPGHRRAKRRRPSSGDARRRRGEDGAEHSRSPCREGEARENTARRLKPPLKPRRCAVRSARCCFQTAVLRRRPARLRATRWRADCGRPPWPGRAPDRPSAASPAARTRRGC